MPTYDYQCRSCGHVIEVIHPMTEDGPTTCEVCGGELRRILHPAGIIFKGSGFYKTDSRSASTASVPAGSTAAGGSDAATAKPSDGGATAGGGETTKNAPSPKKDGASAAD